MGAGSGGHVEEGGQVRAQHRLTRLGGEPGWSEAGVSSLGSGRFPCAGRRRELGKPLSPFTDGRGGVSLFVLCPGVPVSQLHCSLGEHWKEFKWEQSVGTSPVVPGAAPRPQGCGGYAEDTVAGVRFLQCSGQEKMLEALGGQGGHLAEGNISASSKEWGPCLVMVWLWLCWEG